jgi:ABC-2 type transport system permease protein
VTGLRKVLAFLQRDLRSWGSYRFSVFLQLAGIVFVLMIFFFIGEAVQIKQSSAIQEYADNYFDFVVIGLATAGYVTTSLSGFAGQVRDAQISGTLEALLVTPTSVPTLVIGSTAWDYFGATLRFVGFLVLGDLLFSVPLHWERFPEAMLVLVLVIAAFSGIGLLSAAFVMVFKRGDPVAQAVAWFSMLLGGVYFPARAVGDPQLEALSNWLPLTPALRALRLMLLRGDGLAQVGDQVVWLALMALVLLPVGLVAFNAGIRRARVSGSLTHY